MMAEKQSQEERLRQREQELAALKGTMREEASSRDGELERYRRDLRQLQEERDEATKVSAGERALSPPGHEPRGGRGCGMLLAPSCGANSQPPIRAPGAPPNGSEPKLAPKTPWLSTWPLVHPTLCLRCRQRHPWRARGRRWSRQGRWWSPPCGRCRSRTMT